MDVLDRIELCQQIVKKNGLEIRFEDLNGMESGVCELNKKKILMLDLSLSTSDQLEILEEVVAVLSSLPKGRNTSEVGNSSTVSVQPSDSGNSNQATIPHRKNVA